MNKILKILIFLGGLNAFGQTTFVPDDNFEQALINLGYDDVLDEQVLTANINTVTSLQLEDLDISDLAGIEAFSALETLDLSRNFLTSIDVSQNNNLELLDCAQMSTLIKVNIQNGNNTNMLLGASDCPNLNCVQVDDVDYVNANINTSFFFFGSNNYVISLDCFNLSIEEFTRDRITLFPNPSSNYLEATGINQNLSYIIYALNGRIVTNGIIKSHHRINIQSLTPGIYFLRINTLESLRFIKE